MKLSDNEKRDAIKLLQEGKPPPDKYRFLLFADDREVELVWNGKTQEVCNLVLPFQTIEHIDEPRTERIKKGEYFGDLLDPSGRQIQGWTNKLIWGDNKIRCLKPLTQGKDLYTIYSLKVNKHSIKVNIYVAD